MVDYRVGHGCGGCMKHACRTSASCDGSSILHRDGQVNAPQIRMQDRLSMAVPCFVASLALTPWPASGETAGYRETDVSKVERSAGTSIPLPVAWRMHADRRPNRTRGAAESPDGSAPIRLAATAKPDKGGSPSRDSLFEDDDDADKKPADKQEGSPEKSRERGAVEPALPGLRGFFQFEAARTFADPEHWSKLRSRADFGAQGRINERVAWRVGARVDYDAVFDVTDFYPSAVRRDQQFEAVLRENYLDVTAGDLEFRLGRQHIVWGEVVGLFFADVVSARDLREFILPEF